MVDLSMPFREKGEKTGYAFLADAEEDELTSRLASTDMMSVVFLIGYPCWLAYLSYLQKYKPGLVAWFVTITVLGVVLGIAGLREALIHWYQGPEVHNATIWRIDGRKVKGPIVVKRRIPRNIRWLEETVKNLEQELSSEENIVGSSGGMPVG